jgi:glyoxylase I family protein
VFLGDPDSPDAGIVELVTFDAGGADGDRRGAPSPAPPRPGFFLLSFFVDVDATMARLAALGFGEPARRIRVPSPGGHVDMVTVRDPDGVLVELVGTA